MSDETSERTITELEELRAAAHNLPHERVLPFTFSVVDAALQTFLTEIFSEQNTSSTKIRWQQLSSGSTKYHLFTTKKQNIGEFKVFAVGSEQTLVTNEDSSQFAARGGSLIIFLNVFADWLYVRQEKIAEMITGEPTNIGKANRIPPEMLATIFKDAENASPTTPRTYEPPARGASIEAWLDWQDAESRRGRPSHSVSYRRLAEMSGYSVDQFKNRKRTNRKRTKKKP